MNAFGGIKDRKQLDPDKPGVASGDAVGEDEATAELRKVTESLTAPKYPHVLGAKIPRGAFLYGPPGAGKTLLARTVAGEVGVSSCSISVFEFAEVLVGVGALCVRDLSNKAKENTSAVVFVNEIDTVGRGRSVGIGGSNDEREQVLSQLLVEFDGFDSHSNVILITAISRLDVFDPALLRPGRFDHQISMDTSGLRGRRAILEVHARGKPFAPDVGLAMVAWCTPGYMGVDLENTLNEVALLATQFGHRAIGAPDVDEAINRVMAGP